MKISPVAQGTGMPAGAAALDRMPADRLAVAKKIAAGQIVEEKDQEERQVERLQPSIKRIQMRTNHNPTELRTEEASATVSDNANSDVNEQADTVIEETKPLSPQFAALARQKRALQTERAAFDAEKKAFEESRSGTNLDSDLRSRLKSSPLSTLLEEGVTYDQLTEQLLAEQSGATPEINQLRQEIKALKEGFDKNLNDRDTQAETQVLAEMEREAEALVAQGDDFDLVRRTGNTKEAIRLIKETYKSTKEILDVSEALRLVEEDLLNQIAPIAESKKIQTRLTPPAPMQTQGQRPMRTLTSRDGTSIPLSAKQRAIAAFHGQLRK